MRCDFSLWHFCFPVFRQFRKCSNDFGFGIGVSEGSKLKQLNIFGELRKGEAAPFETIFNVTSLTKPIVAMTALRLVSAGKLNLDEPLDKYWIDPDSKTDARHKKLTTRLVFQPLKMHDTRFVWDEGVDELRFAI